MAPAAEISSLEMIGYEPRASPRLAAAGAARDLFGEAADSLPEAAPLFAATGEPRRAGDAGGGLSPRRPSTGSGRGMQAPASPRQRPCVAAPGTAVRVLSGKHAGRTGTTVSTAFSWITVVLDDQPRNVAGAAAAGSVE